MPHLGCKESSLVDLRRVSAGRSMCWGLWSSPTATHRQDCTWTAAVPQHWPTDLYSDGKQHSSSQHTQNLEGSCFASQALLNQWVANMLAVTERELQQPASVPVVSPLLGHGLEHHAASTEVQPEKEGQLGSGCRDAECCEFQQSIRPLGAVLRPCAGAASKWHCS